MQTAEIPSSEGCIPTVPALCSLDSVSQSGPSESGQYLCIECNETFDTKPQLNDHKQCHIAKKQFTCSQCGRGFHHEIFLQMHEKNHEVVTPKIHKPAPFTKPVVSHGISTRSRRALSTILPADVVEVKASPPQPPTTPIKTQLFMNSIVEFRKDKQASQPVPIECVTRLGRAKAPPSRRRDVTEKRTRFELRISKFSDTTVHLIDAFGNSLELLTEVFHTYTSMESEKESCKETSLSSDKADEQNINESGSLPKDSEELHSASMEQKDKEDLLTVTNIKATSSPLDTLSEAVSDKSTVVGELSKHKEPFIECLPPESATAEEITDSQIVTKTGSHPKGPLEHDLNDGRNVELAVHAKEELIVPSSDSKLSTISQEDPLKLTNSKMGETAQNEEMEAKDMQKTGDKCSESLVDQKDLRETPEINGAGRGEADAPSKNSDTSQDSANISGDHLLTSSLRGILQNSDGSDVMVNSQAKEIEGMITSREENLSMREPEDTSLKLKSSETLCEEAQSVLPINMDVSVKSPVKPKLSEASTTNETNPEFSFLVENSVHGTEIDHQIAALAGEPFITSLVIGSTASDNLMNPLLYDSDLDGDKALESSVTAFGETDSQETSQNAHNENGEIQESRAHEKDVDVISNVGQDQGETQDDSAAISFPKRGTQLEIVPDMDLSEGSTKLEESGVIQSIMHKKDLDTSLMSANFHDHEQKANQVGDTTICLSDSTKPCDAHSNTQISTSDPSLTGQDLMQHGNEDVQPTTSKKDVVDMSPLSHDLDISQQDVQFGNQGKNQPTDQKIDIHSSLILEDKVDCDTAANVSDNAIPGEGNIDEQIATREQSPEISSSEQNAKGRREDEQKSDNISTRENHQAIHSPEKETLEQVVHENLSEHNAELGESGNNQLTDQKKNVDVNDEKAGQVHGIADSSSDLEAQSEGTVEKTDIPLGDAECGDQAGAPRNDPLKDQSEKSTDCEQTVNQLSADTGDLNVTSQEVAPLHEELNHTSSILEGKALSCENDDHERDSVMGILSDQDAQLGSACYNQHPDDCKAMVHALEDQPNDQTSIPVASSAMNLPVERPRARSIEKSVTCENDQLMSTSDQDEQAERSNDNLSIAQEVILSGLRYDQLNTQIETQEANLSVTSQVQDAKRNEDIYKPTTPHEQELVVQELQPDKESALNSTSDGDQMAFHEAKSAAISPRDRENNPQISSNERKGNRDALEQKALSDGHLSDGLIDNTKPCSQTDSTHQEDLSLHSAVIDTPGEITEDDAESVSTFENSITASTMENVPCEKSSTKEATANDSAYKDSIITSILNMEDNQAVQSESNSRPIGDEQEHSPDPKEDDLQTSKCKEGQADKTSTPHDLDLPLHASASSMVGQVAESQCVACGQKLRSRRGEKVYLNICNKCSQQAKSAELMLNKESSGLLLEKITNIKEEEAPATELTQVKFIKQEVDETFACEEVKQSASDSEISDAKCKESSTAISKHYKCFKCDKAFRIPALLAGHMRSHTLPQCLTCGCPLRIKYKVRRLPRNCPTCVRHLKETKSKERDLAHLQRPLKKSSKTETLDPELDTVPPLTPNENSDCTSPSDSKESEMVGDADTNEGEVATPKRQTRKCIKREPESPLEELDAGDSTPSKRSKSIKQSDVKCESIDDQKSPILKVCPECGKTFHRTAFFIKHVKKHSLEQVLNMKDKGGKKYNKVPQKRYKRKSNVLDQSDLETTHGLSMPKKRARKMKSPEQTAKHKKNNAGTPGEDPGDDDDDDDEKPIYQSESIQPASPSSESSSCLDDDVHKPHACQECGKRFQFAKSLGLHVVIHTAIKCESCGCRLWFKRRAGRRAKKCRVCKQKEKEHGVSDIQLELLPGKPMTHSGMHKKKNIVRQPKTKNILSKSLKSIKCPSTVEKKKLPKGIKRLFVTKPLKSTKGKSSLIPFPEHIKNKQDLKKIKNISKPIKRKKKNVPDLDNPETEQTGVSSLQSGLHPGGTVDESDPHSDIQGTSGIEEGKINLFSDITQNATKGAKHLSKTPRKRKGADSLALKKGQGGKQRKGKSNDGKLIIHKKTKAPSYILTPFATVVDEKPDPFAVAPVFKCADCDQDFPSQLLLVVHSQSHPGERPFTCKMCPQRFHSKQFLKVHVGTHAVEKPYSCLDCNKRFTRRSDLSVHRRVHAGVRPFSCPHCACTFRQKVSLLIHSYSHTNTQILLEKQYPCDVCKEQFSQRDDLVAHQQTHTEELSFQCNECGKDFPSEARLTVHRKVHTAKGQHPCPICKKVFSYRANMQRHQLKHSGDKPCVCVKCGARFSRSDLVARHMLLKHGADYAFSCVHCKKRFLLQSTYLKHMNVCKEIKQEEGIDEQEIDVKKKQKVKEESDAEAPKVDKKEKKKQKADTIKKIQTGLKKEKTEKKKLKAKTEKLQTKTEKKLQEKVKVKKEKLEGEKPKPTKKKLAEGAQEGDNESVIKAQKVKEKIKKLKEGEKIPKEIKKQELLKKKKQKESSGEAKDVAEKKPRKKSKILVKKGTLTGPRGGKIKAMKEKGLGGKVRKVPKKKPVVKEKKKKEKE